MPNIISIPPAADATIYPSGGTFTFVVVSNCTVCFGTATPPGSFPGLENQTFQWTAGTTHPFPVPPSVDDHIPYNTSPPGMPCSPYGPELTGKIIIVGSGFGATTRKGKAKPARKAKGKPKTKAKAMSKAKPTPKTKAKAKSKSKARPKPKTKAKPKKRAKSKR
jgi:hypothetical protein